MGNGRGDVYRDINELCALEGNHSGLHRNFLVGFSIVCEGRRSTLASVLNLLHIRIHLLAPSFASTLGSGWFLGAFASFPSFSRGTLCRTVGAFQGSS